MFNKLKKNIFSSAERRSKSLFTFHKRPMFSQQVGTWAIKSSRPKIAIVLQGPVLSANNFTLETVKLYNKHFPGDLIILSTWEGEDPRQLELIKKERVEIILNKKPVFGGISNLNFQIVSAHAGVAMAGKMGGQYVLKTRTDQRLYAPEALDFLYNLSQGFPLRTGSVQKQRVVGLSFNTFKFRLYDLSDMNIFGQIDDMLLYWALNLDERKAPAKWPESLAGWSKERPSEVYLATNFLQAVDYKIKWTLADSWSAFADHFCVADAASVDLYWSKYERYSHDRHLRYDAIAGDREMSFADWYGLYSNFPNLADIPEQACLTKFGAPILL